MRTLMQEAAKLLGANGARARNRKLSPTRRSEIARTAVLARWAKWRAARDAKLARAANKVA